MKSSTELTKRLSLPALLGRLKDVIMGKPVNAEFLEEQVLREILDVLPDSFYFACETWNSPDFIEVMKFTKSKMMAEAMKIDLKTGKSSRRTSYYSSGFLWQLSIMLKNLCLGGKTKGPFEDLVQAVQLFANTI